MRVAVIDIGTNTFNLVVADLDHEKFHVLYKESSPVKLGENAMITRKLTDTAMQRGLETLSGFRLQAENQRADKVLAFATAAVRTAVNGADFVKAAFEKTGIQIKVIGGNEEAGLIAMAARTAVDWQGTALIMDIGGGSTEFIVANGSANLFSVSTELGVGTLKEKFPLPEQCAAGDLRDLRVFLEKELAEVFLQCRTQGVSTLIGCAGSFDSLARICAYQSGSKEDPLKNSSYTFPVSALRRLLDEMIYSSSSQREAMTLVPPYRKPFMVYACSLVETVLQGCGMNSVYLSSWSLREGVMVNMLHG